MQNDMKKEFVIVYGPQACGKTRNSNKIAKFLNCNKIIEGDDFITPRRMKAYMQKSHDSGRILVLTYNQKFLPLLELPEVESIYNFDNLMAMIEEEENAKQ